MKKFTFLICSIFCLGVGTTNAQYTDLLNFNGTNSPQGINPAGALTPSSNGAFLYGMTTLGGANNLGCVFSMDTNGGHYKDILDFNGTNGSEPQGGSIMVSGYKLYGMTQQGGADGYGCIYSVDTNGSGYKDLLDFVSSNGASPAGGVILLGNKLYGVTERGGANDYGCIFSIDTNGNGYEDLKDFSNSGSGGELPWASLTSSLSGKVLYGVAELGGLYGDGCIFSIDTNGSNYTVIYNFDGTTGASPEGELLLLKNRLYGVTYAGGANGVGIMYSIDTNGNNYKDLIDFNGTNGNHPEDPIVFSRGLLYDVTRTGAANGNGCIFSIDTNGVTGDSILFNFGSASGSQPYSGLTLSKNVIYGMTYQGGTNSDGVVFSFKDTAINTTGINTINKTVGSITVYPNPSNGIFRIQTSALSDQSSVEVYNMLGEKVYSQLSIVNYPLSIDLSSNPNGVYLYRVLANSGELIGEGKLIIQK